MEYKQAPEVERIAQDLIEEHYGHLLGVRVTCVLINKTPTSKGRAVWGRAKKISGLPAFLADENGMPDEYEDQPPDFFVIEISEEKWSLLSDKGKRALVDEQLVKLDIVEDDEGRVNLAVRDRGVVVIPELIARHGLYNDSLKGAAAIGAERLELLPEEERETVSQIVHEAAQQMANEYAGDDSVEVSVNGEKIEPGATKSFNFSGDDVERTAEGAKHLRNVDPETGEVLEGARA